MPIPLGILAVAGAGAGAAGAYDLLETTLISSNTTSVSFTNLDNYSNYKHLQLRMTVRNSRATTGTEDFWIRFNNDTATNYAYHYLEGKTGSVNSNAGTSQSAIRIEHMAVSHSNTASTFGLAVVDILDPYNTSKNITTRALAGNAGATSNSDWAIGLHSGLWNVTDSLTKITLSVVGGSYSIRAGSRFSLYGIK